jgi:1-acyl-sn-glycerol-3-phosphate acyltransferase
MKSVCSFELSAFLRGLFLLFSAAAYTAILGLPAFASCLLGRSSPWPSFFQRLWVNWLLRTNGIRLKVQGIENLEKDQPYVLVSNHASLLDIPAIILALPFTVRFMAKKSLLWIPLFGWFLHLSGHILIERKKAGSALKSLKRASSVLKRGISIMVFPEGTRSPDGEVKEFKGGAFLLAHHSKFPVVPVCIRGSFEMLPRTRWGFWPGIMHIRMGEPIPTRDLSHQESRSLVGRVRDTIIQNLKA